MGRNDKHLKHARMFKKIRTIISRLDECERKIIQLESNVEHLEDFNESLVKRELMRWHKENEDPYDGKEVEFNKGVRFYDFYCKAEAIFSHMSGSIDHPCRMYRVKTADGLSDSVYSQYKIRLPKQEECQKSK